MASNSVLASLRVAFVAVAAATLTIVSTSLAAQRATDAPPEVGLWIDHTGRGAVDIVACGNRLCGHVTWLKDPNDKKGRPLTDGLNPSPAKRNQPICGLQIIGDLKPQRNGSWDDGWIYDPEKGQSFDLAVTLKGADRLQITGYMGTKLFSETYTWRRAPRTLEAQRCASVTKPGTAL